MKASKAPKEAFMTFKYYALKYIEGRKSCARNTFLQAEYIAKKHLIPAFGKRDISKIIEIDVENYLRKKRARYRIADHKKHLKAIFKLAGKYGERINRGREMEFAVFDPVCGRGKIYSREEIVRLLHEARINKRLRLQVYIALVMGLRRAEVLGFKYSWVNFKTGWMYIPPEAQKVRTTVDRALPVNKTVLRILKAKKRRAKSDYLFDKGDWHQTTNNMPWRRLRRRAKVVGRFHDLRHTACSLMLSRGVPEVFVKKILGMCSDTIRRYAHVPTPDALMAVNEALHRAA